MRCNVVPTLLLAGPDGEGGFRKVTAGSSLCKVHDLEIISLGFFLDAIVVMRGNSAQVEQSGANAS